MQNACSLCCVQPVDDIERGGNSSADWQRAVLLDAMLQRSPRHQLHLDHWRAIDLLAAKYIDCARMADRGRELAFAQKPGTVGRRPESIAQDLQCQPTSGFQML